MAKRKQTGANEASAGAGRSALAWLGAMRRAAPRAFDLALAFSLAINLLMLVSPIYMLQVYDRVLTSGSADTLIWLTLIAVFLMLIYANAEAARRRVVAIAAERLDADLCERAFESFENDPLAAARLPRDLALAGRVRALFQNGQILPFFDLPFTPLFLALLFLVHPAIGALGLIGAGVALGLAVSAETASRRLNDRAADKSAAAQEFADGLARQRSAIAAMGLAQATFAKWRAIRDAGRDDALAAAARDGAFAAGSRAFRQALQILILGAGAALAVQQQMSPGAIVAASIILSRMLAPVDQIVSGWRGLALARKAWFDLEDSLPARAEATAATPLPRPDARLSFDRAALAPPTAGGAREPLVRPFNLELAAGAFVCLVGPNGAGKTTLLQTAAGAWAPRAGAVRLGGRAVHDWPAADRGKYVGYVPQDVELSPGTIAENVARFGAGAGPDASPADVFEAARRAGAHETILALPDGYETRLGGRDGARLSAGQRQLVGLARAFYGEPVLLLLDEPTANLDPDAARALGERLRAVAADGAIVVAATHDPGLIALSTRVLVLRGGTAMATDTDKFLAAQRNARAGSAPTAPRTRAEAVNVRPIFGQTTGGFAAVAGPNREGGGR